MCLAAILSECLSRNKWQEPNYANMRPCQVFTQLMQSLSTQVDRLIISWMIRASIPWLEVTCCFDLEMCAMETRVWNHAMQCRRAAGEVPDVFASICLMLSALSPCRESRRKAELKEKYAKLRAQEGGSSAPSSSEQSSGMKSDCLWQGS